MNFTSQPVIELKEVYFSYQDFLILEGINLTVYQGEFLAIIGPNGAGKTTLLKIILGLLTPEQGEVKVLGEPPTQLKKRKIGYVPQVSAIDFSFPLTVEQFTLMGRYGQIGLGKRPRPEDWAKTQLALKQVGLLPLSKREIGRLSGGQRQKMIIARALAGEPEILILDEPMTAVDPESTESLYKLLFKLHTKQMTIITVSHDVGVVAEYVDRIACINRRLICHDRPQEVLSEEVLNQMYGKEAAFFHHGLIPHIVVRKAPPSDSLPQEENHGDI